MVGAAVLIYFVTRILPSDGDKPKMLQSIKDDADKLKEDAQEELNKHLAVMEARQKELDEIKAIKDEKERLKRLAEFANKRQ